MKFGSKEAGSQGSGSWLLVYITIVGLLFCKMAIWAKL